MFKNLREKIAVSDSNNRNKHSSNSNSYDNDEGLDGAKAPGEQNLSRFSSISSLVSDVGSKFSKALTNPQHSLSTNRNSRPFNDSESVSEYDDSVIHGDIINKEELLQKYQRAQSLARRYKTRSLEVVECYKQLELENRKLTQTLSDSQDCSIRRTSELREQIELDKKAKHDVEENYILMIDEKNELVNVLRLQISLLKEGKDLPIELESEIKEKHEKEIEIQKKKDYEIKELKNIMSQRENLLQRCKEKITSMNTELEQLKMKSESGNTTKPSNELWNEQFNDNLTKQRSDHLTALENLQKEHSERVKLMLCDFEERKMFMETEIRAECQQELSNFKKELIEFKDMVNRLSQDKERLEEQVNIKTKIIEDLITSQDSQNKDRKDFSTTMVEYSHCSEISTDSFNPEVNDNVEHVNIEDLKKEINFLHGRIEQMETLKLRTEEEMTKTEDELKGLELTMKREKEDHDLKCNSDKSNLDAMKIELNFITSQCEGLTLEVSNLNNSLTKKKEEIDRVLNDYCESEERYHILEMEIKKITEEKSNLLLRTDAASKDTEELIQQLQTSRCDYENERQKFNEREGAHKKLQDQCDELSSILEKEILEKNKLRSLLNIGDKSADTRVSDEDSLMLNIVEMRQRYDQQIEEGRQQMRDLEIMANEKNVKIQELEGIISDIEGQSRKFVESLKEEINKMKNDLGDSRTTIDHLIKDKEVLLKNIEDNVELIKEKDQILKSRETIEMQYAVLKEEYDQSQKIIDGQVDKDKQHILGMEKMLNDKNAKTRELEDKVDILEEQNINHIKELEELRSQAKSDLVEYIVLKESLIKEKEVLLKSIQENMQLFKEKDERLETMEAIGMQCTSLKVENSVLEKRIDDKIEEERERIFNLEIMLKDRDAKIHEIEVKSYNLEEQNKSDIETFNQERSEVNNELHEYKYKSEQLTKDNVLLMRNLEENMELIKEKDNLVNDLRSTNENLILQVGRTNSLEEEHDLLQHRIKDLEKDMEELIRKNESNLDSMKEQFCQFEDNCKAIENMLQSEDFVFDEVYHESSAICRLRMNIANKMTHFKNTLQENESIIISLRNQNDGLVKKVEKMSNDRVKHFKVLTNIFELTEVDFGQNTFAKAVMKGMKDYAKRNNSLSKELSDAMEEIKDTRRQLDVSRDECNVKERELVELREKISEDRARLFTMMEERDRSIQRLDEFVDEKGRIDEEKQSLKKELQELNEKIDNLKSDCEKQRNEKQKLENRFNESLEKVKANHLALEETYKREIEKQCGYSCQLEEQLITSREESSRNLTDNLHVTNDKLDEVLKQSEQLLALNHQYKQLLDQSKLETSNAIDSLKEANLKCEATLQELKEMQLENDDLKRSITDVNEIYQTVVRDYDHLQLELKSAMEEKVKSMDTAILLQSSVKDVEDEKSGCVNRIKELEAKIGVKEVELCRTLELFEQEKCQLTNQLEDERLNTLKLRGEIEEKSAAIQTYKSKIEAMKMKRKSTKGDHERQVFEMKQQFIDNKSTTDDDHNQRIKKLAKDFNEKVLQKEQDFQKTFHDALENVRKEEARHKADLKSEIDELNRNLIELEAERNGLMCTISDCEEDVKKTKVLLQTKESQLQTSFDDIAVHKSENSELVNQISNLTSLVESAEQRSKLNQTVDTTSYCDDELPDTVNANDHDILQMHCADVEAQVRQLHSENMNLKQIITNNQNVSSSSATLAHEPIISSTKSQTLYNQQSFDDGSIKSSNIIHQSNSLRSPNNSCSEYQFCPYPISDATEYQYLRDILVKYMTGMETNTLARVLCTVMKLSVDETDRIVRYEQDKKRTLQVFF